MTVKVARARIKRKGQVTIPQEIRNAFGFSRPNNRLYEDKNKIVITPLLPLEPRTPIAKKNKKLLGELERQ